MNKQLVFLARTDRDGNATKDAVCANHGGLSGKVKQVEYLTDNRIPYDAGFSVQITGSLSNAAVFAADDVTGRQTWNIDGPILDGEPIRVVVSKAGQGKCGSFVVTCA